MSCTLHASAFAALATLTLALPASADEPTAPAASSGAVVPGTASPAPLQPAPKADQKTVTVELQANSGHATIERRLGTTSLAGWPFPDASFASVGHWEQACAAPCDLKLDPHYTYRVAGDGLTPSDSFALPRDRDRVKLSAEMGSARGRLAGILLTGLGAGTTLLGATGLILSPIFESQDVGSRGFRSAFLAGSIVFVAAGVLELGMGLYLWATNDTTVRADHGVLSASAPQKHLKPQFQLTPGGVVF